MQDSRKPDLAQMILDNDWESAFQLLMEEQRMNPDDIEALTLLAEACKMTKRSEDGIKYGEQVLNSIHGKYAPDEIIGLVYTPSDLMATVATCYFQLQDYSKALELAKQTEQFSGNASVDTVHIILHSTYELYGIQAVQKTAETYHSLNAETNTLAYACLKIETAKVFFKELMKSCDMKTMQLSKEPLELVKLQSDYARSMIKNLNDVPEDARKNSPNYPNLCELSRQMMRQICVNLYVGNGDYDSPDIMLKDDYPYAKDCFECFKIMNDLGEPLTNHFLGTLYHFGIGTEKDEEKGFRFIKAAAEEDNDTTSNNYAMLSELYCLGSGTPKDGAKAYQFALKPAEAGNHIAQKVLGIILYTGDGAPKNEQEGLMWLKKSAMNGNEGAKNYLVDEASKAIENYDEKLRFFYDFTNTINKNFDAASDDKDGGRRYITVYRELSRFLPFSANQRMAFLDFCLTEQPELIFTRNNAVTPKEFINEFESYFAVAGKEERSQFLSIAANMDIQSKQNVEMIDALANNIMIDDTQTNWAVIKHYLYQKANENGITVEKQGETKANTEEKNTVSNATNQLTPEVERIAAFQESVPSTASQQDRKINQQELQSESQESENRSANHDYAEAQQKALNSNDNAQPVVQVPSQGVKSMAQATADKARTAWNNLELTKQQKAYVILAACATFCFLVSFRFSTFGLSFLSLASAALLLWACLKKQSFPSVLIAIALSVFALRFLATDLQRISGTIYYRISFFTVVNRLALYALVVLTWLAIYYKAGSVRTRNRVAMGIFAYLTLFEVTQLVRGNNFQSFIFCIGLIAFFAAFALFTFEFDKRLKATSPASTQGEATASVSERQSQQQKTDLANHEQNIRQIPVKAPGKEIHTNPQENQIRYADFQPEPVMGRDTNGFHMVYEIMNTKDDSWLTQMTDAVLGWACQSGNGYYSVLVGALQGENKDFLDSHRKTLDRICSAVSEFVTKGFDAYYESEKTIYKGWIIERLFRQEGNDSSAETLLFDYCLGTNGKLYFVVTKKNSTKKPLVMECICYSPAFIRDPFCNVYSTTISGVVGSLDAIPMDRNDSRRNVHLHLDDDYYYDFPIQIDDGHSYPYGFLDGVVLRICALLDDDGKRKCCSKYDWMREYLYPGDAADIIEKPLPEEDETSQIEMPKENHAAADGETVADEAAPLKLAENDLPVKDETAGLDFDKYVLIGAQVASKKPFANSGDDFLSNPDECFFSMFLTNRLIAANGLLQRYPKYEDLVSIIIELQKDSLTDKLSAERDEAVKLTNEYGNSGEMEDGRYILTTAYVVFLSRMSEMGTVLREILLNRMSKLCIVRTEWEEQLAAATLWFADKDGYRDAVVRKYNEIKDTPEYNVSKPKTSFEDYVQCGAKLTADQPDRIDARFTELILIHRTELAKELASKNAAFSRLSDMMNETNRAIEQQEDYVELFKAEFDQIWTYLDTDQSLLDDLDYLVLAASLTAFMERFNEPENNDAIAVIKRIESNKNELYGISSIALYCSALWYANYNDYQQKVIAEVEQRNVD